MPVAQIDDQELLDFINDHGIKDLENFRIKSKLLKLSKMYEKLLSKEPVIAYTYLAIIEAYKNNYELSIDMLEKALRLSPFEPVVLQNLGKSYEQKGDYKKAFESYLAALRISPFDEDICKNTLLLAEYYCDVDTLNELKIINPNYFQKIHLSPSYHLYKSLKKRDFDFDNYRIQLACAYKVIHKHMNMHRSAIHRYYNFDGNYLSNTVEVDHANVDLLNVMTLEFEEEIYKVASSQADGGFDFYDKLSQSNVIFTFLNPERYVA